MIDLETLATTPRAAITEIGACMFDPSDKTVPERTFYVAIDTDEYEHTKVFDVQLSCFQWIMTQSKETQAEMLTKTPRKGLVEAVQALAEWLKQNAKPNAMYWAKGIDFDYVILEHAMRVAKVEVPWLFWAKRDVRTVQVEARIRPMPNPHAHNALADCLVQVDTVQRARALFKSARPNTGLTR